jgi:hypothetical protein
MGEVVNSTCNNALSLGNCQCLLDYQEQLRNVLCIVSQIFLHWATSNLTFQLQISVLLATPLLTLGA